MNGRKFCDDVNGCGKPYNQALTACPYCKTPDAFSTFKSFNPLDWIYDLETYPNIFTASFKHVATSTRLLFEISDRRNDLIALYEFLMALKYSGCRMVGFNNINFDYPIIHFIIERFQLSPNVTDIYNKSQNIINTSWENRFNNLVWESDIHIPQIDLFKIHHFDNKSRHTSLKLLEYNMRMESVEDLPFPPGTTLNDQQKNVLIKYNDHDVDATTLFYIESIDMIEHREQLNEKYNRNFLNHSDKKIGTDIFVHELETAAPGSCYMRDENNRKRPRQTLRTSINLSDVIFPYIHFKEPEFNRVKNWLASQTITQFDDEYLNIKGIFKNLSATTRRLPALRNFKHVTVNFTAPHKPIVGFSYHFGSGGLHGSIDSTIVYSNDEYIIYDWDVAGYYPELGSVNNLYPEHLSEQFCVINKQLAEQRKQYKKGTALNNSIKLARNGAYGDSNNQYSPLYDPKYTMSITINGQLLLCMLAQYLIDIPGLTMVQINTDGLTVRCPRIHVDTMEKICEWWQNYTCLELESATYSRMFIRDVNSYIAEYDDGKLKSKGAYVHKTKQSQGAIWTPNDMDWHQNQSALIVPKAAEAALVRGVDISDFIRNHDDIFDFMLRTKINRSDKLMLNDTVELQRITRYYISNTGGTLSKISPPAGNHRVGQWKRANGLTDQFYNGVLVELDAIVLQGVEQFDELDVTGRPWDQRINTKNRSKYDIRKTGLNVGYLVTPCNDINQANRSNINYDYYIAETLKLVDPLQ